MRRVKFEYAQRDGLKRQHGPGFWSNTYQIQHPRAFRRYLWGGKPRKVPPVSHRRRIDRFNGVTALLSDRVPYRGVFIFTHWMAEKIQNRILARRNRRWGW